MKVLLALLTTVLFLVPGAFWGIHEPKAVYTDLNQVTISWTQTVPIGQTKTVLVARGSFGFVDYIGTTACAFECSFVDLDAPAVATYTLVTLYDLQAYGPITAMRLIYAPNVTRTK